MRPDSDYQTTQHAWTDGDSGSGVTICFAATGRRDADGWRVACITATKMFVTFDGVREEITIDRIKTGLREKIEAYAVGLRLGDMWEQQRNRAMYQVIGMGEVE